MKKLMLLLLAASLLLSAAVCFAQEPANMEELKALDASLTEDIVIEIWGKDGTSKETSRGTVFTNFANEYSALFDHVTIEYIHQGGYDDVREKVTAASVAGDLPGIWMAEESTVKSFAAIAADLNEWVPEATVSDYLPGLLSSSLYDGDRLIGAPAARSNPVLFVNNEVLAEVGWTGDMIKTNDDMFQCAKDIYEKTGKPGFAIWWDTDLWNWESAVYADGGQILTDDGQHPSFGKDYDYVGAKYALRIQEGLKEGYVTSFYSSPEPYDQCTLALAKGDVGILLISSNSMKKRYDNCYGVSVNGKPYLKKLVLNENNNAIAQCRDLVAQYKALEPNGFQIFVIPTDTGFRKAQTTSVPVQAKKKKKKDTLEALSEIAEALK